MKPNKLIGKRAQVLRAWKGTQEEIKPRMWNPKFTLELDYKYCAERKITKKRKFLIMDTAPPKSGTDPKLTIKF